MNKISIASGMLGACIVFQAALGAQIQGKVADVKGDVVQIVTAGEDVPNVGDKVEIIFQIPGLDDVAQVGAGQVTEVRPEHVLAKIDQRKGKLVRGQQTRITSEHPQTRASLAGPAATLPPAATSPAMPATSAPATAATPRPATPATPPPAETSATSPPAATSPAMPATSPPATAAAPPPAQAATQPRPRPAPSAPPLGNVPEVKPAGWYQEFRSREGGFQVRMPGPPSQQNLVTANGATVRIFSVQSGALEYTASFTDLGIPLGESEYQMERRLDQARDGATQASGGTVTGENQMWLYRRYPGREVVMAMPDGATYQRMRYFLVGQRLYAVMVAGPWNWVNSDDATGFLDSFALTAD